MKSHKLKIPLNITQKDLTIIYKDSKDQLYEIKTSKKEILRSLQYFEKQSNEINKMNLIYIEENIKFDIFESFIKSVCTKEIDIDENNYRDYYYLCCKYKYEELKDIIDDFIQNRPDIFSILTKLTKSENQTDLMKKSKSISQEVEDIMAKNIDFSIKTKLFNKLPLAVLVRILNSPKRSIIDHPIFFSFVSGLLKEKQNENISDEEKQMLLILPSCLDYCEMNSEEIEELYSMHSIFNFFYPKNSQLKIQRLISDEKKSNMKFKELESQIAKIDKDLSEKFEMLKKAVENSEAQKIELEKRLIKIENIYKESEEQKNDLTNQIKKLESKNEELIKKIDIMEKKCQDSEKKQNQSLEIQKKSFDEKIEEMKEKQQKAVNKLNSIEISNSQKCSEMPINRRTQKRN